MMDIFRNRIVDLIAELKADVIRPDGRYGIHGHKAVDDDYFTALEYVITKLSMAVDETPDTMQLFDEMLEKAKRGDPDALSRVSGAAD